MNTVRFTQVVEKCGRPHVHTLWVTPEKDSEFMRAHKAGRVMTISHSGGKTEGNSVAAYRRLECAVKAAEADSE
ncbi:MAG: hypothetical protein Q7S40_25730 [Opitutaceae bacterium]|nr:hypothetical protein [Opitutaceae bacterium]